MDNYLVRAPRRHDSEHIITTSWTHQRSGKAFSIAVLSLALASLTAPATAADANPPVNAAGRGNGNVNAAGRGNGNVNAAGRGNGNVAAAGRGRGNVAAAGRGRGNVAAGRGAGNVAAAGRGAGNVAAGRGGGGIVGAGNAGGGGGVVGAGNAGGGGVVDAANAGGGGVVNRIYANGNWVAGVLYQNKGKIIGTAVVISGTYYLLRYTETGAVVLESLENAAHSAYDQLVATKDYFWGTKEEAQGAASEASDKTSSDGETTAQNGRESPTDEGLGNKSPITTERPNQIPPSSKQAQKTSPPDIDEDTCPWTDDPSASDSLAETPQDLKTSTQDVAEKGHESRLADQVVALDSATANPAAPVNNEEAADDVTSEVPARAENPSDQASQNTGEPNSVNQEDASLNAAEEGSAPDTSSQETEAPAPEQTVILNQAEAAALMLEQSPVATAAPIRPAAGSYLSNAWAANTMFQMNLNDRLSGYYQGETRPQQGSAWIRYSGSRSHLEDTSGELRTTGDKNTVMMGIDMLVQSSNALDQFTVGVMGGYGHYSGHTKSEGFDYATKGTVNGYSVGLYGTYQKDVATQHGFYADSWLLWNQFDNRVKGGDLPAEKYDSKGMMASLELGYNIPLSDRNNVKYVLQPHAQVMYQNVRSENFRQADNTSVDFMNRSRVQTTLGVRAAAHITTGLMSIITPHFEANWLHANKGYGVNMDNVEANMNSGRNIGQVKLGVQGDMNRRVSLNIELFHNQGNAGYHETGGNVTAKYRF